MKLETILKKSGFTDEISSFLIEKDSVYFAQLEELAEEYAKDKSYLTDGLYVSGSRDEAWETAQKFGSRACAFTEGDDNPHTVRLLFWLHVVPYIQERYREKGISEDIFWQTAKDLKIKCDECMEAYGVAGSFTDWFFLMADLKLFALGRLHYEFAPFEHDSYRFGNYELKRNELVLACHIPSDGPLKPELCLDSLKRAYEFFKPYFKDGIMPVTLYSWLIYPPYAEKIYKDGSNLKEFYNMFHMLDEGEPDPEFGDFVRIFGKHREDIDVLPQKTSLQRGFAKYLEDGNMAGRGFGICLFDGEKIINR